MFFFFHLQHPPSVLSWGLTACALSLLPDTHFSSPPLVLHRHTTIKTTKSLVNSCWRLAEYRFWIECFPETNPLKSAFFSNGRNTIKQTTLQSWLGSPHTKCFNYRSLQAALNFGSRAETQRRRRRGRAEKRSVDSPEEDRLSLPDGDVVHHLVVGLRVPLAADWQPCGHKKQNPQREKKRAFGKSDQVASERHRLQPLRSGGEKKSHSETMSRFSSRQQPRGDYFACPQFISVNPDLLAR